MEQVKSECDTSEPLIDETYGYGSQSLINLMITGRAVTYVWDNEQDVGGLSKLLLSYHLVFIFMNNLLKIILENFMFK